MNKEELIERIAAHTGNTKASTERFLAAFLGEVEEALANGEKVRITDFGHFETYTKKGSNFRNVSTGKPEWRPERKALRFTIGKRLKDRIEASEAIDVSEVSYGEV